MKKRTDPIQEFSEKKGKKKKIEDTTIQEMMKIEKIVDPESSNFFYLFSFLFFLAKFWIRTQPKRDLTAYICVLFKGNSIIKIP